jgi:hypothetical protein
MVDTRDEYHQMTISLASDLGDISGHFTTHLILGEMWIGFWGDVRTVGDGITTDLSNVVGLENLSHKLILE